MIWRRGARVLVLLLLLLLLLLTNMLAVGRRHTVCSPIIPLLLVLEGWPSSCLHVERGRVHLLVLTLRATLATAGPQDAHTPPVGGAVAASPDAVDGVGEEDRCVTNCVLSPVGMKSPSCVRVPRKLFTKMGFGYLLLATLASSPFLRSCKHPHPLVIKQEICALAAQTNGGATAEGVQATQVDHLISMLEESSGSRPIRNWAARGNAMSGTWDQVYTNNTAGAGTVRGNGISSRRRLVGPLSGRVLQVIKYEEPFGREIPLKFTYAQRACGRKLALGLQAEMTASVDALDDGITWSVNFEELSWSLLGGRVPLRKRRLPSESGGTWRTTYLDADTRILRSQNNMGGPPTVYVLRKAGSRSMV